MLSDEEKQAIEYLKRHIIPCYGRKGTIEFMLNDIVLNLIEKQSKEIEELKEVKWYYEISRVPKDKIKAKIEEVEQWELYNMKIPRLSTLDERLGAKIGIKYVLQSLLEKEELNKSDASKEQSSMNYYNLYRELVEKIKAKIEEVSNGTYDAKIVLQSLLEKE